MKKFPVTIVDDFFDHPDVVRNWALTLKYTNDPHGRYPGKRSPLLTNLSDNFSNEIVKKILSLFYDYQTTTISWEVEASFQRVSPRVKGSIHPFDEGWIHSDPCEYSGVIYLNKNFPSGTGTSVYKFMGEGDPGDDGIDQKFKFYKNEKVDEREYISALRNNNDKYVETVRIENIYNRMIMFEGGEFHGVPTFHTEMDEDRLTLVFFIHKINFHDHNKYPIERLKYHA